MRRLGAITLAEQPLRVTPNEMTARMLAEGIASSASTGCRGRKRCGNGATACMFLRRAEGEEWPDLSDAALAATAMDWLAAACAGKTALADLGADDLD